MRAICAELKKSRRRHNALVAVGISLAALLWATQTGGKSEDVSQGYSGLLYAIPIINTVIMPLGTAIRMPLTVVNSGGLPPRPSR